MKIWYQISKKTVVEKVLVVIHQLRVNQVVVVEAKDQENNKLALKQTLFSKWGLFIF